MVAGNEGKHAPVQLAEESGEAAAIGDDGVAEFIPECPIEPAGRDAEITADIGNHGADRAATHLGGDFRFGGQAREARVLGVVGLDVWRDDLRCGSRPACGGQADGCWLEVPAAGGPLAERSFQRRGAPQASGDAVEDGGEVGGAEGFGEQGEAWNGGAVPDRAGELLAVVDQFADEAKNAVEGGGRCWVGPRRIAVWGWGGAHEQNKNTPAGRCQGKSSCAARAG